jgi:hypothetical protein
MTFQEYRAQIEKLTCDFLKGTAVAVGMPIRLQFPIMTDPIAQLADKPLVMQLTVGFVDDVRDFAETKPTE